MTLHGRALFGTGRGLVALGDGILSNSGKCQDIFEFSDFRDGRNTTLTTDGLEFIRPVAGSNLALVLVGQIYPANDASGRKGFIGAAAICEATAESIREAHAEINRQDWMEALTRGHRSLADGDPFSSDFLPPVLRPQKFAETSNLRLKRFSDERIGLYASNGRFLRQAEERDLDLIARRLRLVSRTPLAFVFSDKPVPGYFSWGKEVIERLEEDLRASKLEPVSQPATLLASKNALVDSDDVDARLRRLEGRNRTLEVRVNKLEMKFQRVKDITEIVIYGVLIAALLIFLVIIGIQIRDLLFSPSLNEGLGALSETASEAIPEVTENPSGDQLSEQGGND